MKNQLRGLRCTIKVDRLRGALPGVADWPRHLVLTGDPVCGKKAQAG